MKLKFKMNVNKKAQCLLIKNVHSPLVSPQKCENKLHEHNGSMQFFSFSYIKFFPFLYLFLYLYIPDIYL